MKVSEKFRQWWSNQGFQKYLKNTSWLIVPRIVTMGISFISTTITARYFGPTNFGQISYAVSITGIFGFFATLGIDSILYRDLLKFPERKGSILGTAFWLRLAGGTATTVILLIYAFFIESDSISKLLILLISGTYIFNAFQVIYFEAQSRVDARSTSIATIAITLLLNALKIAVALLHLSIIYFGAILLAESIFYALAYIYIHSSRSEISFKDWVFDKLYAFELILNSFPLIMQNAFMVVYSRIDQVIIGRLISISAVGQYDAAVRIAELWTILPYLLINGLYPAIISAKKTSPALYGKRMFYLATLIVGIAVLVSLLVTIFAPLIIHTLYGEAFSAGITILRIYVWAFIGTSLGIFISQYLITENMQKILGYIMFIPMVINITLNLIWVPDFGIIGAAYATLISYSLTPLMVLLFKQPREDLRKLAASLMQKIPQA